MVQNGLRAAVGYVRGPEKSNVRAFPLGWWLEDARQVRTGCAFRGRGLAHLGQTSSILDSAVYSSAAVRRGFTFGASLGSDADAA